MAQKAKAPSSPGEEVPCKIQKCGTAEFTREKQEEPDESPAVVTSGAPEESAEVLTSVTSSAQVACDIPDARLIAEVQSILVNVDLQSMTLGALRARLEGNLGLTDGALAARKRIRRRLSFVVHQEVLKKSQRSQQCEKVVKEILRLDDYPLPARQMLIESLHHSICTNGDTTLHPHQVRLLGIARDALLDGKSKLEAAKVTIEEALQKAEMDLAAQDSATTAALASEVSACHSAAAAEAAAKETEIEVAETEQELERKRGLAKDVIQETAALQKRRLKASEAEASLKCLAEGTWAREEEWWECFAALQQHLLDTGAENSLLTAATLALKKKPGERSSFHAVAVEGVGNFFSQQLETADQELVQQSRLEMEAEATILGIEALLTATRQRACQRREAADAGAASKESMQSAARQAEKCLQASKEAVAQKQQEQVDLEGRLTPINEALELVGAWMAGNALPTAVEVPLPLQSPSPEEAEDPPQEADIGQKEEGQSSPVASTKVAPDFGVKDDGTAILGINSPLRVPTPMKGRS